jgi:hypothetical protein
MEALAKKKDSTLVQQLMTSTGTEDNKELQLAVIASLSTTIEDSIQVSTPVQELIRKGGSVKAMEQTLALMITKAASMLSVGGNLRAGHPMEIAKMLLVEYPLCSLDDFQIMLHRGVMGKYNDTNDKLIRFDVSVIFSWANEYMNEWAETKEKLLAKERAILKEQERLKLSDETVTVVTDFIKDLANVKQVPSLTEKDIALNGKERPRKMPAIAPVREEFIVGDQCEYCLGNGCDNCSGLGKVNAIKVHADSLAEAQKMYELSKSKKVKTRK